MEEIQAAVDLLRPGETSLIVFTEGRHLEFSPDGTGTSGNWVIDPERQVDRFILYVRPGEVGSLADVYRADYEAAAPAPVREGRFVVSFRAMERVGITRQDWAHFADTGANPVRYLSRPTI
jgi:hypothetical protein